MREEGHITAHHAAGWTRRAFLGGLTLAGTAGLLGWHSKLVTAEPPPETTKIKLYKYESICIAPQYVVEEVLRSEGFTEVHYVTHEESGGLCPALASGAADLANDFAPVLIRRIDAGDPIAHLGGLESKGPCPRGCAALGYGMLDIEVLRKPISNMWRPPRR
jgi:hypothetical protein